MTGRAGISRRAALQLLAWWVGLGASPLRALAANDDRVSLVQRLLPHRASAISIGRRYLREHPEEASPERLAGWLELPPAPTDVSLEAARRLGAGLRATHRADLREGRVVQLDGWLLSITELRLAALLALQSEASE